MCMSITHIPVDRFCIMQFFGVFRNVFMIGFLVCSHVLQEALFVGQFKHTTEKKTRQEF
jgi:hypothetical protein